MAAHRLVRCSSDFPQLQFPKEFSMDNNEKKPGQPQQGGKGSNDDSKQPQQQGDKSKQAGGDKSDDKSRQNK
tara:strand:- start:74 stop:289 length:216 start_codon:yes stop_codon:yes gene_type:complete